MPVLDALRSALDRPAFEHGPRVLSRVGLLALVGGLAAAMRAVGLGGPGTSVAIVLPLSPEAYAVHLAAHALGCTVAAPCPEWSAQRLRGVDAVVAETRQVPGRVLLLDDLLAHPGDGRPLVAGRNDLVALPEAGARSFERCLIDDWLAGPLAMTYLGCCLLAGGTVVIDALTPQTIEAHRITAALTSPSGLHRLLAEARERPADLRSLRALVLGPGEP